MSKKVLFIVLGSLLMLGLAVYGLIQQEKPKGINTSRSIGRFITKGQARGSVTAFLEIETLIKRDDFPLERINGLFFYRPKRGEL